MPKRQSSAIDEKVEVFADGHPSDPLMHGIKAIASVLALAAPIILFHHGAVWLRHGGWPGWSLETLFGWGGSTFSNTGWVGLDHVLGWIGNLPLWVVTLILAYLLLLAGTALWSIFDHRRRHS